MFGWQFWDSEVRSKDINKNSGSECETVNKND
jgi:hypothetical protein